MWMLTLMGLFSAGYGLFAMMRSATVARKNAAFIDSGKEVFFEQRRSWKAFGTTPPRDAAGVYRAGRKEFLAGLLMLAAALLFYLFAQG
ncbi:MULTISPECIES: hypothetical protein [Sphingobium]|jgi:hypothetical protein|uniref:hypothetical protein n=1 Tax=Sphingobium TaxID=165695 RepID=UPI001D185EB3|nr:MULTISPECIES: hypothetical protein [Sphingobium]MCC4255366.1 hypothetical protein [Sphingobium lactosutens]MEC9018363.1 hypothetical protein [Pseudomonadota bacterium]MEE2740931.1 hypothetical protein [Pseudomonadota bacterium]|tara:strand:+ start:3096 stop:3362 length:267 start_codon:yes stop_codon:yes gene_type:complete